MASSEKSRGVGPLDALPLKALQARFKEVVGEESRSPNRKFLIRRIEEEAGRKRPGRPRGRFGELSLEALREKYVEVVRRPTGSTSRPYLMWKIREAEKGHVPVGPRVLKRGASPDGIYVVPFRLAAGAVQLMDAVWQERGIPSRTEFMRLALEHYLQHLGAEDAAKAFSKEEPASAREG